MGLNIFAYAALVFLAAFLCHVIVWRWVMPKAQIVFLFAIFGLLPLIALGILLIVSSDRLTWSLSFFLYFSLAGVYVQTYPAIQANCPSLFIVHIIGRSRTGLGLNTIRDRVENIGLTSLDDRVNDLLNDRLIAISAGDAVSLTSMGRMLALVIVILRQKILGLKEGEG